MPVDDRIRDGLRRNAATVAPHTEGELQATLARAHRRSRTRRLAVGLVTVVAAVPLGLAAPQLADGLRNVSPPAEGQLPSLPGSWAAQVAPGRAIVDGPRLVGTWTLTFTVDGAVHATPPGAYPGSLAGVAYDVTDRLMRTDLLAADVCADQGQGSYRVVTDGSGLRFRAVRDRCPERVALLSGQSWHEAGPGGSCVNSGGGACLGDLAAGTYRTSRFRPTATYTVPAGWTNSQDLPGNALLQPAGGDERFVGIYRDVTVPTGCKEVADPDVGTSVDAIVAWLARHPGLRTAVPRPVTMGELTGVRLDVSLDPEWRRTCGFSNGRPVVAILFGDGRSVLHHVLLPGFTERLYLLRAGDGNVVVEVGPEGRSLPELLESARPLLDGLRFDGAG